MCIRDSIYRVRKSWEDAESQKGAFTSLDNAAALAKSTGLKVYDGNGKQVYPAQGSAAPVPTPAPAVYYRVRTQAHGWLPEVKGLAAVSYTHLDVYKRQSLDPAYTMEHPGENCTFRQIFQWIGAAHGGNWIISDGGKLLLVPLLSAPEESYFLIDERGDAITFGGDRILVG